MEKSNKRGFLGEEFTSSYLEKQGAKVLKRNYRTRQGEIDIITEEGETLHFIEVKTRLEDSIAEPAEFVDVRKQRKIILASLEFLQEYSFDGDISFDVYEVICQRNCDFRVLKLKIHRNAFNMNEKNSKGLNL